MRSWYRTIREDELKDGSIRKVYHLVFETDDKNIVEKVEQFFCDVMDAKTEPSNSEIPNNCDEPQLTPNYCGTCKHREVPCGDLPCDVCHGYSNYEPKDEPTISKMEQVEDEPQTDWHYDEQDATWYPYKHEDEPQTDCAWMKGE